MAEKEERIYIDVENDNLDRLKHLSMTRQEAIERIGDALFEAGLKEGANYYAEAALNALLEGE